jgi:hypothetical protein
MIDPNDSAFPYLDGDLQFVGLTIREYMAARLFAGILSSGPERQTYRAVGQQRQLWAEEAVACADALIAALNAPVAAPCRKVREDDGEPE